eukprot:3116577-Lingulodinium_polyedra.AAC.1
MKWRAHGAHARNACCRAETAKRAFGRTVAQRFGKCCRTMRSNARCAASARRNAPRTHAPRASRAMAR